MKALLAFAVVSSLAAATVVAQEKRDAPDILLLRGRVFTGDAANPWAEAVAIKGNRIVAVGKTETLERLADKKTEVLILRGRVVVPGFNDAHYHQTPLPEHVDVPTDPETAKWRELSAAIASATDETPASLWILATVGPQVYRDASITRATLDKVAPNRRVLLREFTGHGVIASSAALKALHIADNQPDPVGGRFERDANGVITGRMSEYAQYSYVDRPLAEMVADDEAAQQLHDFADQAVRFGITSVQNMSDLDAVRYERAARAAQVPLRLRIIRQPRTTPNGRGTDGPALKATDKARPRITVSGTKWILDGTPLERGAAVRSEYENGGGSGQLNFTEAELVKMLRESVAANDPILLHVAGDATANELFTAMRELAPTVPWPQRRVRIEHGDGLLPDLIPSARELGTVVVVNPAHFAFRNEYPVGDYMPFASLLRAGIPVAIGSDGPLNPFLNLMLAVDQKREGVTREEAVAAYTRGSAYAENAENDKGTIAPGKLADLAVLSQDIFAVHLDRLPSTKAVVTIIDGQIVLNDLSSADEVEDPRDQ